MYCIIKCIVQGKQARVKNADLRHPSCTVVTSKRKSASPVLNVLRASETFSVLSIVLNNGTIPITYPAHVKRFAYTEILFQENLVSFMGQSDFN